MKAALQVVVTVECVQCGNKCDIQKGEVPADDVPWCEKCYMPMVAVSTKVKKARE